MEKSNLTAMQKTRARRKKAGYVRTKDRWVPAVDRDAIERDIDKVIKKYKLEAI